MATSTTFILKEPQKRIKPSEQKETPINLFFNYGNFEITNSGHKKYIPLKFATGLKIKPCYWNDKPTYRAKQTSNFEYKDFNTHLDNIEGAVKKAYLHFANQNNNPSPLELKEKLNELLNRNIKTKNVALNLNEYIEYFIKNMQNGERLTLDGSNYKPGTIKNFKGFRNQFEAYQKQKVKRLNFDNITIDFYDDFLKFFNSKNYSKNTIGKHIKILKTIMRFSRDEGLHTNSEFDRKKFKILQAEVYNIYLNDQEIQRILELDLSSNKVLELARDVFLIGCFTAQRFSDYSTIKKQNIKKIKGGKVISLIQEKTGESVIIPIKPELDLLLSKYDYTVPKIWDQKLNKHIKEVGKLAKIDETVELEKTKGGLIVKETRPKYDLIKTHTARRSGCTNMYKAGIPTISIMKISGHKTETEFLKYIKVSKEETAQNLINHPYFQQNYLKKVN